MMIRFIVCRYYFIQAVHALIQKSQSEDSSAFSGLLDRGHEAIHTQLFRSRQTEPRRNLTASATLRDELKLLLIDLICLSGQSDDFQNMSELITKAVGRLKDIDQHPHAKEFFILTTWVDDMYKRLKEISLFEINYSSEREEQEYVEILKKLQADEATQQQKQLQIYTQKIEIAQENIKKQEKILEDKGQELQKLEWELNTYLQNLPPQENQGDNEKEPEIDTQTQRAVDDQQRKISTLKSQIQVYQDTLKKEQSQAQSLLNAQSAMTDHASGCEQQLNDQVQCQEKIAQKEIQAQSPIDCLLYYLARGMVHQSLDACSQVQNLPLIKAKETEAFLLIDQCNEMIAEHRKANPPCSRFEIIEVLNHIKLIQGKIRELNDQRSTWQSIWSNFSHDRLRENMVLALESVNNSLVCMKGGAKEADYEDIEVSMNRDF